MSDADETLPKKYWQSLTKPRLHLHWSFISDSNMTQNLKVKHILDKRIEQVSHHNVTREKFESFSFVLSLVSRICFLPNLHPLIIVRKFE